MPFYLSDHPRQAAPSPRLGLCASDFGQQLSPHIIGVQGPGDASEGIDEPIATQANAVLVTKSRMAAFAEVVDQQQAKVGACALDERALMLCFHRLLGGPLQTLGELPQSLTTPRWIKRETLGCGEAPRRA